MNLKGRSFLKLLDFTAEEIRYLLDLSFALKQAKRDGREQHRLSGRNIALIFEKTSTRTRCAFEVAAYDQGAHVTYLGPTGSQRRIVGMFQPILPAHIGRPLRAGIVLALLRHQALIPGRELASLPRRLA